MLIALTNTQIYRILDKYQWSLENGHVCQVADGDLLKEMFTNPGYEGQFKVAASEPLLTVVESAHHAELLVIYGDVTSVEQLASLSKEDAERLAAAMLETKRTVSGWVSQAKTLVLEAEGETAVSPSNE